MPPTNAGTEPRLPLPGEAPGRSGFPAARTPWGRGQQPGLAAGGVRLPDSPCAPSFPMATAAPADHSFQRSLYEPLGGGHTPRPGEDSGRQAGGASTVTPRRAGHGWDRLKLVPRGHLGSPGRPSTAEVRPDVLWVDDLKH